MQNNTDNMFDTSLNINYVRQSSCKSNDWTSGRSSPAGVAIQRPVVHYIKPKRVYIVRSDYNISHDDNDTETKITTNTASIREGDEEEETTREQQQELKQEKQPQVEDDDDDDDDESASVNEESADVKIMRKDREINELKEFNLFLKYQLTDHYDLLEEHDRVRSSNKKLLDELIQMKMLLAESQAREQSLQMTLKDLCPSAKTDDKNGEQQAHAQEQQDTSKQRHQKSLFRRCSNDLLSGLSKDRSFSSLSKVERKLSLPRPTIKPFRSFRRAA